MGPASDVPVIDAETRRVTKTIQDDWENRELVEIARRPRGPSRAAAAGPSDTFGRRRGPETPKPPAIAQVQLNVLAITKFLNNFDSSTRYKLARINEKLSKLERALDYCEAAVRATLEME